MNEPLYSEIELYEMLQEMADRLNRNAILIELNPARKACNIPSRSLLDTDETAAATFNLILDEFDGWKRGQE